MSNKMLGYCFSAIRTIPVIFITAVVVWSYYAYVIQMCLFSVDNIPEKVLYLIFYHPFLIMFLWSFWKTIFTPIALPPYEYNLASSEQVTHDLLNSDLDRKKVLNNFGRSLGVQCRLVTGDVRFCEKCNSIKPDRAHHCSVCGKCILKLDHHCPWVNNCICFSNYKFFFLFLAYGLLYCLYVFATTVKYFIQFWSGISTAVGTGNLSNLHIVFLFFASVMFFISLVALLSYHCYLVALNRTTIESFQVPMFTNGVQDCHAFNLGFRANFREVFGDNPKLWFLPIFSSFGDGLKYPTRFVPLSSNYNTMDSALNIGHTNLGHGSLDSTPTVIDMYSTSDLVNGKEVIQSENDDTNRLLREGSNHGTNGGISVTNYPVYSNFVS